MATRTHIFQNLPGFRCWIPETDQEGDSCCRLSGSDYSLGTESVRDGARSSALVAEVSGAASRPAPAAARNLSVRLTRTFRRGVSACPAEGTDGAAVPANYAGGLFREEPRRNMAGHDTCTLPQTLEGPSSVQKPQKPEPLSYPERARARRHAVTPYQPDPVEISTRMRPGGSKELKNFCGETTLRSHRCPIMVFKWESKHAYHLVSAKSRRKRWAPSRLLNQSPG